MSLANGQLIRKTKVVREPKSLVGYGNTVSFVYIIKEEYSYNPDRRTFQKLMQEGAQGKKFVPFHKNKLSRLTGMKIYKIDDDVETNRDECNGVEVEISTTPKDEAR